MHAWWRVGWLAGCVAVVSCGGQSLSHRSEPAGSGGSPSTSSGGTSASGGSSGSGTRSPGRGWLLQPGVSTDDQAYGVGVDADDRVFVLRTMNRIGGGQEPRLDKYDRDALLLWTIGVSEARPTRLAVRANGTSILAGARPGPDSPDTPTQLVVTAYDANANRQWTSVYDGQGPIAVLALNVDVNGHAFVLWTQIRATLANNNVLSELDEDGNLLTSVSTSDPGPVYVSALDPAGNLLEAGGAVEPFIRVHDSRGNERWTTSIDGTPAGLYGDSQGDSLVVALVSGGQIRLTRLDAKGRHRFERDFGGGTEFTSLVTGDAFGRSFTVGITTGNGGSESVRPTLFDEDGNLQSAWSFGSGQRDQPMAVAADSTGALLIVGFTTGAFPGLSNAGGTDAFIARIVPDPE